MSDLYADYLLLLFAGDHPAPAPLDPLEAPRLDGEVTAAQCEAMDDTLEAMT